MNKSWFEPFSNLPELIPCLIKVMLEGTCFTASLLSLVSFYNVNSVKLIKRNDSVAGQNHLKVHCKKMTIKSFSFILLFSMSLLNLEPSEEDEVTLGTKERMYVCMYTSRLPVDNKSDEAWCRCA